MKKMWDGFIERFSAWKKGRADLVLRLMIKRGVALDKEGKSQKAIAYFDEVLLADPKNPMAWSFKAGALLMLDRMREAKEAYQNFVQYAGPEHAKYVSEAKTIIRDLDTIIKTENSMAECTYNCRFNGIPNKYPEPKNIT
jgi:tetratricopeptide (TPR) repeat protein